MSQPKNSTVTGLDDVRRPFALRLPLILCCIVTVAGAASLSRFAVAAPAAAKYDPLIPPGCEPREGVDLQQWRFWTGPPRNLITCREKVPPAIWPHPDVPKPRWPVLKRVPHGLDLPAANESTGKEIVNQYFHHLCETESGVWFYRDEKEGPPFSVINLRPRIDYSSSESRQRDRYWLSAPALANRGMIYEVSYNFKGDPPFRGVRPPLFGRPTGPELEQELYDKEWDPVAKKSNYWLRTDPPRQYERWFAYERNPGSISVVERPPVPQGDGEREPFFGRETGLYPGSEAFSLFRVSYAPVGELKSIRLVSGREVLASPPHPAPSQCLDEKWKKEPGLATISDCFKKYGTLHLIITRTNESIARYGYAWREFFVSEHDLRLGITGGEMLVADMKTGKTIALYRSFSRTVPVKPYSPFRSSELIDTERLYCGQPEIPLSPIGQGFIHSAIGTDRTWTDPRRAYELKTISPLPVFGDELETQ